VAESLERRFVRAVAQLCRPGQRVAVAVSGGADSIACLRLFAATAEELGLCLRVAHYDHGWRPDSAADAAFVAELAARLGLEVDLARATGPPPAADREQQARRQRYQFFKELLACRRAERVATAHTADDQAETVLLRLLRGAGPEGLAGVLADRGDGIIRPLLGFRRAELRAWLQAGGQGWREDVTNLSREPLRNRIRQEWLPRLEAEFNPALTPQLARLAEISGEEARFWAAYCDGLLAGHWQASPSGGRLPRARLRELPVAVQRRLLRRIVQRVQGDVRQLDFRSLEEVRQWAADERRHPRHRRLAGLVCRITAGNVEFERADRL
jgi:tRNA(Ile)-lysidine synthase